MASRVSPSLGASSLHPQSKAPTDEPDMDVFVGSSKAPIERLPSELMASNNYGPGSFRIAVNDAGAVACLGHEIGVRIRTEEGAIHQLMSRQRWEMEASPQTSLQAAAYSGLCLSGDGLVLAASYRACTLESGASGSHQLLRWGLDAVGTPMGEPQSRWSDGKVLSLSENGSHALVRGRGRSGGDPRFAMELLAWDATQPCKTYLTLATCGETFATSAFRFPGHVVLEDFGAEEIWGFSGDRKKQPADVIECLSVPPGAAPEGATEAKWVLSHPVMTAGLDRHQDDLISLSSDGSLGRHHPNGSTSTQPLFPLVPPTHIDSAALCGSARTLAMHHRYNGHVYVCTTDKWDSLVDLGRFAHAEHLGDAQVSLSFNGKKLTVASGDGMWLVHL